MMLWDPKKRVRMSVFPIDFAFSLTLFRALRMEPLRWVWLMGLRTEAFNRSEFMLPMRGPSGSCTAVSSSEVWPSFVAAQMPFSYGHPPLPRTRCPRDSTCLRSVTALILVEELDDKKTEAVIRLLLRTSPVMVRRVVVVLQFSKVPKRNETVALAERFVAGLDAKIVCDDCGIESLYTTGDTRFVVLCEGTNKRAAVSRAAAIARTPSILLVDTATTPVVSLSNEELLDTGLRTHLNRPYQAVDLGLRIDDKTTVRCIFLQTVSLLAYAHTAHDDVGVLSEDVVKAIETMTGLPTVRRIDTEMNATKNNETMIHVVWAADEAAAPGLLASVSSAVDVAGDPLKLAVHIVYVQGNSTLDIRKALECVLARSPRRPGLLRVYNIPATAPPTRKKTRMKKLEYLERSAANYLRYDLDRILPTEIKTYVWLDADTIVRADLTHLVTEFQGHPGAPIIGGALRRRPFAAQVKPTTAWPSDLRHMAGDLNGSCAFNAGVLVVDRVRFATILAPKIDKWLALDADLGLWPGQTQPPLLLATRDANFAALDPAWNVLHFGSIKAEPPHVPPISQRPCPPRTRPFDLPGRSLTSGVGSPEHSLGRAATTARIIHFTSAGKPWLRHGVARNRYLWVEHGRFAEACLRH